MCRRAGWIKTLCACVILVNPVAKFALTMEPVAFTARSSVAKALNLPAGYLTRYFNFGSQTLLLHNSACACAPA